MPLHIYFNNKDYFIEKSNFQGEFDDLISFVLANKGN